MHRKPPRSFTVQYSWKAALSAPMAALCCCRLVLWPLPWSGRSGACPGRACPEGPGSGSSLSDPPGSAALAELGMGPCTEAMLQPSGGRPGTSVVIWLLPLPSCVLLGWDHLRTSSLLASCTSRSQQPGHLWGAPSVTTRLSTGSQKLRRAQQACSHFAQHQTTADGRRCCAASAYESGSTHMAAGMQKSSCRPASRAVRSLAPRGWSCRSRGSWQASPASPAAWARLATQLHARLQASEAPACSSISAAGLHAAG